MRAKPPLDEANPRARFQGSLFDDVYIGGWPKASRFPNNSESPRVAGIIKADLRDSVAPLVIAGFASLDRLIVWLSECQARLSQDPKAHHLIRLLIGHEPFATERRDFRLRGTSFPQEVIDYWSERGVSLHLSAQVLAALELVRTGPIEVRTSSRDAVHAKIYVGDAGISIGSSNFTTSGLERQVEANVRFTPADDERWREARGLAERIWETGQDFRGEFAELLERLLQGVTWQEALARASAELLEGSWAERFRDVSDINEGQRLWPSQEQGIAHALWVLEHQGSVLVADATGSGKTLMGAHLVRRIMTRLVRTGRGRNEMPVLMAPPAVIPEWERCATECGAIMRPYSRGHLSQGRSHIADLMRKAIRRTQVLVIDEAHNFLRRSKRTTALFSNMADHVVLFTATPVNRGPRDILAMIDLLGADNLDDETLGVLTRLWKRGNRVAEGMSDVEMNKLRRAIRRFTVRRTKSDLNRMVEREPERYQLPNGRVCRYPRHHPHTYQCNEPPRDLEVAAEIRSLTAGLRGLTRLQKPFELTNGLRRDGLTEESYRNGRLSGAAALAAHDVAAGLRSSRVRLLEHLRGTRAVLESRPDLAAAGVSSKRGVIDALGAIGGRPPRSYLSIPLPDWLSDADAHAAACHEERGIYEQIEALLHELSDTREQEKAALLSRLVDEHGLVLAFDSHLITLADLRLRIQASRTGSARPDVIVATGEAHGERRRLYDRFRPGSGARGIIALCSDAVAEGVNLQAAPAVVMLDMPSVIRVAEQRIGRVDRMNSPHDQIEAYWPIDPPAFAVRSSERLAQRYRFVADHLGSNLQLPSSLGGDSPDAIVRYEDFVAELDAAAAADDADLQDVFAPVRALVDGTNAIVPRAVYANFRHSRARVLSSVSIVESNVTFAFVAIAGTDWGSPRWVYLPHVDAAPVTDLDEICRALRQRLTPATRDRPLDTLAAGAIDRVLDQLEKHEETLLPRGKQRALHELRRVLGKYATQSQGDVHRARVLDDLISLSKGRHKGQAVDRAALAEWWLQTIQPVKFRHLQSRARLRPVLLKDLRSDLLREPLDTETLERALDGPLIARGIDERVVAAIVGVSDPTVV